MMMGKIFATTLALITTLGGGTELAMQIEQANVKLAEARSVLASSAKLSAAAATQTVSPQSLAPITSVYLSDAATCPAGLDLVRSQAPDGVSFVGDLNHGGTTPLSEISASGCECTPSWRVDNLLNGREPGLKKPKKMWEREYGCRRKDNGRLTDVGGDTAFKSWCVTRMHEHNGDKSGICTTGHLPLSARLVDAKPAKEVWTAPGKGEKDPVRSLCFGPNAGLCAMAEPCVGSMAYAQTKRTCEGLAARLPTVAELKAGSVIVDEATMCGEDPATRMVWTSDECDGGNGAMSASVDGRGTLSCLPKHGIAARLCVAASDAMVTRFIPGNKQRARRPRGITVNNGNTTLALDLQWDPCLEKVVRSPSYRSVTRGGCTCAKGSDGRTQTCQRLPATDIVRMRERRAKGSTSMRWCEYEPGTCNQKVFTTSRKKVRIGLPRPITKTVDVCPLMPEDARALHVCVGRGVTPGVGPVVEIFLHHGTTCPADYEEAAHAPTLTGSLNDGTGGLYILICLRRNPYVIADEPPINDIVISGGETAFRTCPAGYGTPKHTPIRFQALYDEVELPLNLRAYAGPSGDNRRLISGLPWYVVMCTHVQGSAASILPPPLPDKPKPLEVREDGNIAFLFLVYHQIDNEALWEIFFEGAPKELKRSWLIIIHHKPGIVLGSWAKRMQANGQLMLIPREDLVDTAYCTASLVEAQIVMMREALYCEKCPPEGPKPIEHMVLVSGNSLPVQNFATVYHNLLHETNENARGDGIGASNLCFEKAGETNIPRHMIMKIKILAESTFSEQNAPSLTANTIVERLQKGQELSKAVQWATFNRADATWLVEKGWPAAKQVGMLEWRYKSYGCADEVLIPSLLALGKYPEAVLPNLGALAHKHKQCRTYIVWGRGFSGVVSAAPNAVAMPPTSGVDIEIEGSHVFSGGYPDSGIWWQHQASPLVFANLPAESVRACDCTVTFTI